MSQLTIVPLPISGTQLELEYALSAADGALIGHGRAVPALLPQADQISLVLPPAAVSWHAVHLPKLPRGASAQKWQAVLSGLLEERLLDDPEDLHLVAFPGLKQADLTWVAACRKGDLSRWVQALQETSRPVTDIVPALFPSDEASLHVAGTPESPVAFFSDSQGVLVLPLQAALLHVADAQTLSVTSEPAVAALAERLGLKASIEQPAHWLAQCALRARARSVSLARGEFERGGGHRFRHGVSEALRNLTFAPSWRPFRWGVAGLVAVQLLGLNAWAWKQGAELDDKRAQVKQTLTSTFPHVKVVVDAPIQMQREMALLRQSQGQLSERDFESMYGRFLAISGLRTAPTSIDFVGGELQLRGVELNQAQTQALQPRLQFAGLAMRMEGNALILTQREFKPTGEPASGVQR